MFNIEKAVPAAALTAAALLATVPSAVAAPGSSAPGSSSGPTNFLDAYGQSITDPTASPAGANDWNCTPTAEHPDPVVLVHGTWENAYANWSGLAPALADDGYCVFALNYGDTGPADRGGAASALPGAFGTADIADSAGEIATYVDAVRDATGAAEVDLVGHSQGGLVSRQYLKFNGGAEKVGKVVTLGATNHGTTMGGIGTLGREISTSGPDLDPALSWVTGVASVQQVVGSPLLTALNADGDTLPGIDYTAIATRYDEVTTPYESTFLTAGPGATVDNITVQDGCAVDHSDHLAMSYSPRVTDLVRNALTPGSVGAPRCTPNSPLVGAGTVGSTEGSAPAFGLVSGS
jgi:triacylglycerol esterase/lipase EstA (alpha/beta hydrolase family)